MNQHSSQACLVAVARGIDIDVHRAEQVSVDAPRWRKVNAISQGKEGSHCLVPKGAATGHDVPSELLVGIAGCPPRYLCFGELESPTRDAVPHGGATCTNMQKGLEIISKSNMVSLSSIRLSFTIGQGQNLGIMWSTATLSRRPLMRSWAVKRPDPANTSTP